MHSALFHIYGLAVFACGLLGSGSTIVVLSKFDLNEMLATVEKHRLAYLPIVPPILLALINTDLAYNYDMNSLHTVICGAAPLSKECTALVYFSVPPNNCTTCKLFFIIFVLLFLLEK